MRIKLFLPREMVKVIISLFISICIVLVCAVQLSLTIAITLLAGILVTFYVHNHVPRKMDRKTVYIYNGQMNGRLLLKTRYGFKLTISSTLQSVLAAFATSSTNSNQNLYPYQIAHHGDVQLKDEVLPVNETLWFMERTKAHQYSGKCFPHKLKIGQRVKCVKIRNTVGIVAI